MSDFGGVEAYVKKVYIHPKFDGWYDYNIAVLELQDWDASNVVHGYAKLPKQDEDIADGVLLQLSFYDVWYDESKIPVLTTAKINQTFCRDYMPELITVTDRMICAAWQDDGKRITLVEGDPLTKDKNVLVGLHLWDDGDFSKAIVFTRVASVRNWIKQVSGV